MKSHITIGAKLMTSFGLIFAVAGALALWSWSSIKALNARFDVAVSKTARKLQLGSELNQIKSDMYVAQRGMVLASFMKDAGRAATQKAGFAGQVAKMRNKLQEIHPLISVPEGRRLLGIFENDLASWLKDYEAVAQLCQSGDPYRAQQLSFEKIVPVFNDMSIAGDRFVNVYREVLEEDKRAALHEYEQALWICLLVVGVLVAVGTAVFSVIRKMNRTLRQAVSQLFDGAAQTVSAASQVSATSQSLAQGSSEQAASLEETSASSEEINSMARKNAENSRAAADLVLQSQQNFAQANAVLEQTVVAMGEISAHSGRISNIIKVIDEIAFQTNILALNAAVEAARAGEAGMGFSVVADEVRNLAQRCAQAAKDTSAMIEESIAKSTDGKAKVDRVAEAIRGITQQSSTIKTLVEQVNLGSIQQARDIEQIARTIEQMDHVTQKTASNAEESASAAEELNAQSEILREVVERLSALVGGSDAGDGRRASYLRRTAVAPGAGAAGLG